MHVESVEGTVKGQVKARLGKLTLIVGPNGSGKSRLINTLELALLGFASDIVGRPEMRKEADLVALTDSGELTAKAVLSDGRVCEWGTTKTKTGAKRADHVKAVSAEFPVTEVRNALTGSVETARKWLLQRIAATVSRGDITKYLTSDESEALYASKAKYFNGSEVDILLGVFDSAKSEKRSKSMQLTATGKNIATLAEGLPVEPTEAQLNTAKEAAKQATEAWKRAIEQNAAPQTPPVNPNDLLDELTHAAEIAEKASQYLTMAKTAYATGGGPLTEADSTLLEYRKKLIEIVQFHLGLGATNCLVCNGAIFGDSLAMRESTLTSAVARMAARSDAEAEYHQAVQIESQAMQNFQRLRANYEAASAAWSVYESSAAPSDTSAVDAAQAAFDSANTTLNLMQQAATGWKSVRSLRQEEREAKKAIAVLEDLIEGCKAAVEGILKTATSAFIARVQTFLPPTDTFDLVLDDGDREVCRFGFVRGGSLHTALSGAEWARLTLALACATSTDDPQTLRIFVPEDRAFDPHTLKNVLEALSDAPGQVIIATTTKPAGRLPKGWTLVETGGTE